MGRVRGSGLGRPGTWGGAALLAVFLAVGPAAATGWCAPGARDSDAAEAVYPRPKLEGGPEVERRTWQLLLPAGGVIVALALSALLSPIVRFFIRHSATTNPAELAQSDPWIRARLKQGRAAPGKPGQANDAESPPADSPPPSQKGRESI